MHETRSPSSVRLDACLCLKQLREERRSAPAYGERPVVKVIDDGAGVAARDSPALDQGLAVVGALAQSLKIAPGPDRLGTIVTMSFGAAAHPPAVPRLEPLCGLALERLADVSCMDVVSGGVLRRPIAEFAADSALTRWLREAGPPAKLGTANWRTLREGGPQLVVHDPSVPRSPAGTGERLGLTWWVAVPLEGVDGTLAALGDLGGRDGGRPVPSAEMMRALADAARADLAQETNRGVLRARLALT